MPWKPLPGSTPAMMALDAGAYIAGQLAARYIHNALNDRGPNSAASIEAELAARKAHAADEQARSELAKAEQETAAGPPPGPMRFRGWADIWGNGWDPPPTHDATKFNDWADIWKRATKPPSTPPPGSPSAAKPPVPEGKFHDWADISLPQTETPDPAAATEEESIQSGEAEAAQEPPVPPTPSKAPSSNAPAQSEKAAKPAATDANLEKGQHGAPRASGFPEVATSDLASDTPEGLKAASDRMFDTKGPVLVPRTPVHAPGAGSSERTPARPGEPAGWVPVDPRPSPAPPAAPVFDPSAAFPTQQAPRRRGYVEPPPPQIYFDRFDWATFAQWTWDDVVRFFKRDPLTAMQELSELDFKPLAPYMKEYLAGLKNGDHWVQAWAHRPHNFTEAWRIIAEGLAWGNDDLVEGTTRGDLPPYERAFSVLMGIAKQYAAQELLGAAAKLAGKGAKGAWKAGGKWLAGPLSPEAAAARALTAVGRVEKEIPAIMRGAEAVLSKQGPGEFKAWLASEEFRAYLEIESNPALKTALKEMDDRRAIEAFNTMGLYFKKKVLGNSAADLLGCSVSEIRIVREAKGVIAFEGRGTLVEFREFSGHPSLVRGRDRHVHGDLDVTAWITRKGQPPQEVSWKELSTWIDCNVRDFTNKGAARLRLFGMSSGAPDALPVHPNGKLKWPLDRLQLAQFRVGVHAKISPIVDAQLGEIPLKKLGAKYAEGFQEMLKVYDNYLKQDLVPKDIEAAVAFIRQHHTPDNAIQIARELERLFPDFSLLAERFSKLVPRDPRAIPMNAVIKRAARAATNDALDHFSNEPDDPK